MLISCAALLAFPLLAGQAKQAKTRHTYQPGVVIGWSSTPASTSTYTVRDKYGGVHPRPVYTSGRKFYELQGKEMIYTLNNCGKFKPKQAVQYRTNGDWLYIARDKKKGIQAQDHGREEQRASESANAAFLNTWRIESPNGSVSLGCDRFKPHSPHPRNPHPR